MVSWGEKMVKCNVKIEIRYLLDTSLVSKRTRFEKRMNKIGYDISRIDDITVFSHALVQGTDYEQLQRCLDNNDDIIDFLKITINKF